MDSAAGVGPSASGSAPLPAPYGPLPVGYTRHVWARRKADEAEAKALASSLRLRILRLALHEPRTNKELADALGRDPASVLHHVRTLVDTGFLVEQPVRRGPRGSRERPYLASGKSFYVDTGDYPLPGERDLLLETFLEEIAGLPSGALDSARLGFRLNARDLDDVRRRLGDLLNEIAAMPSDPDGESWSLYLGLHPEAPPR
ncbi:MAG: helix-turn-helix transcriptional regulator [Marmoricola sp.]|nr:helix-turn-helix transcriptional regulator [Marmoricola sp.]